MTNNLVLGFTFLNGFLKQFFLVDSFLQPAQLGEDTDMLYESTGLMLATSAIILGLKWLFQVKDRQGLLLVEFIEYVVDEEYVRFDVFLFEFLFVFVLVVGIKDVLVGTNVGMLVVFEDLLVVGIKDKLVGINIGRLVIFVADF